MQRQETEKKTRFGRLFGRSVSCAAIATALTLGGAQMAASQSLQEVVALAIDAHPAVRGSEAAFRAAERAVEEERGAFLPAIDLTSDTGYQRSDQEDVSSDDEDLWRARYRLSGTQLLFDGFSTSNRVDASTEQAEAALFDVRSAANQIANRAISAYLSVARDRELLVFAQENVELHRQILGNVDAAAEAGGGSTADVAQVRTRLAFAESQQRRLRGDLRNSEADFREAVGQSPSDLIRPTAPLGAVPDTLEMAIAVARESNPNRSASIASARAAGFALDVTRGPFLPRFDVELAHEGRRGVGGERDHETDSTALLRLSWNLYNGGSDTAARRRAREEENEALLRTREVDRLIQEEMEVNYNNLEVARDQLELLRDRVGNAAQVTDAYQEQFRLGQRTVLDLLDSGNELFVARVDLTRAEYEVIAAAYDVLTTAGTVLSAVGVAAEVRDVGTVPHLELGQDAEWQSQ
ncbi:TolC family outer membrane protein [Algihabitans albus]|uniref:TolC family outer membrane protein n=1 Tax=Algihabitans albus TaxID=2164067 RepID=UPI0013C304EC|nr:TolC family outer membrane protein [Algihabitans albus]